MSDPQPVDLELGLKPSPAIARPRRLVRGRDRDREFVLRRALLGADLVALCVALALAMVIASRRNGDFSDGLWILATLPAWALLVSGLRPL